MAEIAAGTAAGLNANVEAFSQRWTSEITLSKKQVVLSGYRLAEILNKSLG